MLVITGVMEDTQFKAVRGSKKWYVEVWDSMSMDNNHYELDDKQFGACLALASAGHFPDDDLNKKLWDIAEKAMPGEQRIIP